MKGSITRTISLPDGVNMEVTMTEQFMDILRSRFGLTQFDQVTDEQVKIFFAESTKNALDKHEADS